MTRERDPKKYAVGSFVRNLNKARYEADKKREEQQNFQADIEEGKVRPPRRKKVKPGDPEWVPDITTRWKG